MTESRDNPFWAYSLALYRRPGMDVACLALQYRLDLDVNMLLFCCWAGSRGRTLDDRDVGDLVAAARPLRDGVILPLRQTRRALKALAPELGPAAQDLREAVKADELAAEAIQQTLMHSTMPVAEGEPSAAACAANLLTYLRVAQAMPASSDWDALGTLLARAFPDLSGADARGLLGR